MKFGVPWTGGASEGAVARTAPQSSADELTGLNKRLDQITQQLQRATRGAEPETNPDLDTSAPVVTERASRPARFEERLGRLTAHDSSEDEPAIRPADPVMGRRPDSAAPPPRDEIAAALDQAIAEISLRQQMLDREADAAAEERNARKASTPAAPFSAQFSGLEKQLQQITTQMESLNRPYGLDEAVAALRQDLGEIGRTLAEAMPRRAIEALEAEVRALSDRVYESRHSGADSAKLAGVERGLAEVRDALHALTPSESLVGFEEAIRGLADKVDQIASTNQDPAALEEVQTAIPPLRGIVARVASDEALQKLTDEVRELSARVERIGETNASSGLEALSTMEQRLAELTDAMTTRVESKPVLPPELDTVIAALADKFEQMHLSRGDQVAMGHLENRIAQLVEKLDSSDSRLDHLAAIERGLAELLVRLEELRSAGVVPAGADAGAPGGGHVASLERDLADIKQAQSQSERRTQETFEAVQGTLGEVVDRLATIESDLHGASEWPQSATESKAKKAFRSLLGSAAAKVHPAPIDPSLPPDHPLEPGTGPLRERAGADSAFDSNSSDIEASESEKAGVISAARRALRADAAGAASTSAGLGKGRGLFAAIKAKGYSQKIHTALVAASVVVIVLATVNAVMNMVWPDRPDLLGFNQQNTEASAPAAGGQGPNAPARTDSIPDRRAAAPADNKASPIPPSGVIVPEDQNRMAGPTFNPSTVLGPQADAGVTGSIPLQAPGTSRATPPRDITADKVPATIASPALRVAAANGDASAEYEVGIRFAEGRTVTQNFEEAARWLDRAARAGIVPAQFRLGSLYEKGLGVKKDIETARKLYIVAAEKGHAKAMHNLAVLYAEGLEGKPDYKNAAQWFSRAANHGVADSQYNLGILYARGIGVEQNLAESYKWFTLAAGQGDQDAAKKRDDVAGKLDAQALMAARLAAQTWTAAPQPEEATTVKTPAGGWDKPVSALQPAKPRPRLPAVPKVESL